MALANESGQNSAALKNITVNTGTTKFNTAIEYDTDANNTAYSRVKHYINNGDAYSYAYDAAGNISKITNPDGTWVTYTYDALNQLIKESYSDGRVKNYTYDERGNILKMDDGSYQIEYGYDAVWKDRLVYVGDMDAISYDEIGNPLQWYTGTTMTWQHGRQLASYTSEDYSITYQYDADGVRTGKTVNGQTTTYTVADGTLRFMTVGDNTLQFVNNTSLIFNGTEYWYVYNAQGDVVGLIDNTGTYVVQYTYDAWGNILSQTDSELARLNPFRYRGYIYDEESGFYYVSSRYYDPVIGRWLNSDSTNAIIDYNTIYSNHYNLYAYCINNPVMYTDPTGHMLPALISAVVKIVEAAAYATVAIGAMAILAQMAVDGNLALELPDISSAEIIPFPTPEPEPETKPEIFVAPSPELDRNPEQSSRHQEYFPANPFMFKPKGLMLLQLPGTHNGRIFKWMDANKTVYFEWNEDYKYGPHYHVFNAEWNGEHYGPHYKAGEPVPEPWNSLFFGGKI